ncbi:VOC family protein [Corallococcus llansteffanensis]|uniref:VOC family protein n=1 Tax=Corallococcus llansteffanensis TaxID=2316731 RepID=A0A3A8PIV6_9BACT|nr:VOC family protein [Corallococcus llansteffanensis]
MQKIVTFLWFNKNAEEAARFYTSLFKDSQVLAITRYGEGGPGAKGSVMTCDFQLAGQKFTALNGGPQFPFTEAISLSVNCDTQAEIDDLWNKLTADGGKPVACGWLKDRFGLFWQIVPSVLPELLNASDPERSNRVMQAVQNMVKLDLAALKQAAEGR